MKLSNYLKHIAQYLVAIIIGGNIGLMINYGMYRYTGVFYSFNLTKELFVGALAFVLVGAFIQARDSEKKGL